MYLLNALLMDILMVYSTNIIIVIDFAHFSQSFAQALM